MSPPARSRVLAAALVSALALTGCGGGDDDAADPTTPAGTAAAESSPPSSAPASTGAAPATLVETSGAGTEGTVADLSEEEFVEFAAGLIDLGDPEQSRCLAEAVIDAIGFERIEAAGITPEEFANAGDLGELGLPIDESAAGQLQSDFAACGDLVQATIDSSEVNEADAACLREFLTNDLIAETLVVEVLGTQEPSQALLDARTSVQECIAGNG